MLALFSRVSVSVSVGAATSDASLLPLYARCGRVLSLRDLLKWAGRVQRFAHVPTSESQSQFITEAVRTSPTRRKGSNVAVYLGLGKLHETICNALWFGWFGVLSCASFVVCAFAIHVLTVTLVLYALTSCAYVLRLPGSDED